MSTPGDYQYFKATVPERRIFVGIRYQKLWRYYDYGPRSVPPILCIPGAAGTADVFYKQILGLSAKGYRIMAVDAPAVWSHQEWVDGFERFLDSLHIYQVHLYGTSLGGLLAQLFSQVKPRRVKSLLLSNTFLNTHFFSEAFPWNGLYPYSPEFVLKGTLLSGFRKGPHEPHIADSIDFVVGQLDTLGRAELASRLTLNTMPVAVEPLVLPDECITIMDTNDYSAVPQELRDDVMRRYPGARRAHLKDGGDFPFLSRADEVSLHIVLHLRRGGLEIELPNHLSAAGASTTPPPGTSPLLSHSRRASTGSVFGGGSGQALNAAGVRDSRHHAQEKGKSAAAMVADEEGIKGTTPRLPSSSSSSSSLASPSSSSSSMPSTRRDPFVRVDSTRAPKSVGAPFAAAEPSASMEGSSSSSSSSSGARSSATRAPLSLPTGATMVQRTRGKEEEGEEEEEEEEEEAAAAAGRGSSSSSSSQDSANKDRNCSGSEVGSAGEGNNDNPKYSNSSSSRRRRRRNGAQEASPLPAPVAAASDATAPSTSDAAAAAVVVGPAEDDPTGAVRADSGIIIMQGQSHVRADDVKETTAKYSRDGMPHGHGSEDKEEEEEDKESASRSDLVDACKLSELSLAEGGSGVGSSGPLLMKKNGDPLSPIS